jgi:hypothetical protein
MAALQTARRTLLRETYGVLEEARPSAPPPHFPEEQVFPEACEIRLSIAFIAISAFSGMPSQGDRL